MDKSKGENKPQRESRRKSIRVKLTKVTMLAGLVTGVLLCLCKKFINK